MQDVSIEFVVMCKMNCRFEHTPARCADCTNQCVSISMQHGCKLPSDYTTVIST